MSRTKKGLRTIVLCCDETCQRACGREEECDDIKLFRKIAMASGFCQGFISCEVLLIFYRSRPAAEAARKKALETTP